MEQSTVPINENCNLPTQNTYDQLIDECETEELPEISEKIENTEVVNEPLCESQRDINIHSAILKPKKLMVVPICIDDTEYSALLDTGSQENYVIQSIANKFSDNKFEGKFATVGGIGECQFDAKGSVEMSFDLYESKMKGSKFLVVDDYGSIRYHMIIGRDFMKANRMSINLKNNLLGVRGDDGSLTKFELHDDGKLRSVIYSKVPVYAAVNMSIEKDDKTRLLEVNFGKNISKLGKGEYFFEGNSKCVEVNDGIISSELEQPIVMISSIEENKKFTVKEGDKVGTVSSLIEVEKNGDRKTWSRDEVEGIKIGSGLTEEQKDQVYDVLMETQEVLGKNEYDIGNVKVPPHQICLTDDNPVWQKPRVFSDPVNQKVEEQCQKLLANHVIRESHSAWSSPVVPVIKSDGSLRMCIDYRRVNAQTKTEHYPMPNLESSIYSASKMQYFSKLDMIKGYYQIKLDENSKPITAFSTNKAHYEFNVLAFGLKNSGMSFQKAMQKILSKFSMKNVIVYIDDILLMSATFEEHLDLIRRVLNTLLEAGVTINMKKCELFQPEVSFLGHLISNKGIRKSPAYTEKIRFYPKPKTVTDMRKFLGVVNFQRKFIDKCSEISKPLSEKTVGPKKKNIEWNDEMNAAFEQLKQILIEDVTLAYPDHSENAEPLQLFVDASGIGVGCCLYQKQGDEIRTIGFSSMTFNGAQRRYSTIEREITAIRFGVKSFKPFIYGVKFVIWTDHRPLVYLRNMANDNSRLMRTINELSEYNFQIQYCPGVENVAADALSRISHHIDNEQDSTVLNELPKGFRVIAKVEGGGDSFFQAVMIWLSELTDDEIALIEVPLNHARLRNIVVTELLEKPDKFKIKLNKTNKKFFQSMLRVGNLPSEEVIMATAEMLKTQIWVHHGMISPVVYKPSEEIASHMIIHLQCLAGVHYNPIVSRKGDVDSMVKDKYVNGLYDETDEEFDNDFDSESGDEECVINCVQPTRLCSHALVSDVGCTISVGSVRVCAMVDSGAEVNTVNESTYKLLLENSGIELLDDDTRLGGIVENSSVGILGAAILEWEANGNKMNEVPFAVMKDKDMPCCVILGSNSIHENDITINFDNLAVLTSNGLSMKVIHPMGQEINNNDHLPSIVGAINVVASDESEENDDQLESFQSADESETKITINDNQISELQKNNHAICLLRDYITNKVKYSQWRKCTAQFKRYAKQMYMTGNTLMVEYMGSSVPVVPFPFMVEVVFQIHKEMAHIGRNKLRNMIGKKFWHPAYDKIISDICRSCAFCQKYKVSRQTVKPPTLKIKGRFPFDLVAVDLVQFEESSSAFKACLVTVDNISKFLSVIPIKDKTSATVARVLETQVIPSMIRVPCRMLSDNGPEFVGSKVNDVLRKFNIDHAYISSYKASSNGQVERSNRTIIQLLKALAIDNPRNWDKEIPKLVITYNNTYHSQIAMSPAEFILQNCHRYDPHLPIDAGVVESWKPGHPNYFPFEEGQKVLYRKPKIGNRARDKLMEKYVGPFTVVKIQSNNVSYEVQSLDGSIKKVHHTQLKSWVDVPRYISQYLPETVCNEDLVEDSCDSSDSDSDMLGLGLGCSSSSGSEGNITVEIVSESVNRIKDPRVSLNMNGDDVIENGDVWDRQLSSGEQEVSPLGDVSVNNPRERSNIVSDIVEIDGICRIRSRRKRRYRKSRFERSLPNFEMSILPLDKLHCTEPINYKYADCGDQEVKHSTPNNDEIIINRGIFDLSENVQANSESSESNDIVSIMEQSLKEQAELVDRLECIIDEQNSIEKDNNITEVDNVSKRVEMGTVHEGIGESNHTPVSAKSELIKIMKEGINSTSKYLLEYKLGKNAIGRKLIRDIEGNSNDNLEINSENHCENTPLSSICLDPAYNRPYTRSRGPVRNQPNVPRIALEYEVRRRMNE